MSEATLESLQRRDRLVAGAALTLLLIVSWVYLLYLSTGMSETTMSDMPGMAMSMPAQGLWGWVEVGGLVVMWSAMMVAMMTAPAAPMILMFATIRRRRTAEERAAVPTALFVFGYVAVWIGFSVVAAATQTGLHAAALLSTEMSAANGVLAGALLITAGAFQWTPLKRTCLAACRSPMSFLLTSWREGRSGALVMGAHHGLYCLGCCWALMGLLFVAGVMNLLWVAAISAAVLVEKVVPRGDFMSRVAGLGLAAAGVLFVLRAIG